MQWWYGIVANSLFFTSMWALTARFMTTRQQFLAQLLALPLVYVLNVWYGKSSVLAYDHSVPFPLVIMLSVGCSAVLAFLFGVFLLKQDFTALHVIGAVLVVAGVVMMKI